MYQNSGEYILFAALLIAMVIYMIPYFEKIKIKYAPGLFFIFGIGMGYDLHFNVAISNHDHIIFDIVFIFIFLGKAITQNVRKN